MSLGLYVCLYEDGMAMYCGWMDGGRERGDEGGYMDTWVQRVIVCGEKRQKAETVGVPKRADKDMDLVYRRLQLFCYSAASQYH